MSNVYTILTIGYLAGRGVTTEDYGIVKYSKEELIAELVTSMICSTRHIVIEVIVYGIAAYISGWLQALHGDKRLIAFVAL